MTCPELRFPRWAQLIAATHPAQCLCRGGRSAPFCCVWWRAFGPWIAFAVSAALFGFGHIADPNAPVFAAICIALEAGIMLGAFCALTARVWVSIGVHAAWPFTRLSVRRGS